MTAYNTAQLAVYCVLALPIVYLIFRHGRNGVLGYFYLFVFAGLRIIGAAMGLKKTSDGLPSTGAIVISNIGLSPLLLASIGILHEARVFRSPNIRSAIDLMLIGIYHFLAVGGIVLIAMGAANLNSDDPNVNRHEELTLLKIGIIVLLLCYVLLVIWTLSSFGGKQSNSDAPGYPGGTTLLRGVVCTLPFTLIRLIFSTISIFTQKLEWNPFFGKLGIRIGMSFLPELITILIFVVVGLATSKLKYVSDGSGNSSDVQGIIGFGQKHLDRHTRRR